ncbi:hypothetical protein DM02DRAFT_259836 [Periconia macrospinosa]|uniref:Uncharacterized protein n=1 Tax=Periconia macrospinosa TaxID=97972 RepID=A0A2V1D6X5_9PLEO|nr:hypothetical protein DM02DRAFT_259836 [Periconia macrospinosa]
MFSVWFFLSIKGRICISRRPRTWSPDLTNEQFRNVLLKEYREIYSGLSSWSSRVEYWFKEIGFVYFDIWESYQHDFWTLVDKDFPLEVNSGRAEKSVMDHFRYLLRHPPNYGRPWSKSVDNMVALSRNPRGDCPNCGLIRLDSMIMIEIVENVSTLAIIVMTVILIFASLIIGIVYAVVVKDAGAAFTIASYAITAFAFFVAIYAAGQWLGMESPESFIDHVSADGAWLEGAVFRQSINRGQIQAPV